MYARYLTIIIFNVLIMVNFQVGGKKKLLSLVSNRAWSPSHDSGHIITKILSRSRFEFQITYLCTYGSSIFLYLQKKFDNILFPAFIAWYYDDVIIPKISAMLSAPTLIYQTKIRTFRVSDFFFRKNLDRSSLTIFAKWKLFLWVDLIPSLLYEVKSGIDSTHRNYYHCGKIVSELWSRFLTKMFRNVCVRLFGRLEYKGVNQRKGKL